MSPAPNKTYQRYNQCLSTGKRPVEMFDHLRVLRVLYNRSRQTLRHFGSQVHAQHHIIDGAWKTFTTCVHIGCKRLFKEAILFTYKSGLRGNECLYNSVMEE